MTSIPQIFKTPFGKFVCENDTFCAQYDGFQLLARIYRDDSGDTPEERDDGFWPSLDKTSACYIGPKSKRTFERHMAKAKRVMQAWRDDEWFYCGVVVSASREGVQFTGKYDHALWGIECNYPDSDNEYLRVIANELAEEALAEARGKLAKLTHMAL